MDNNSILLEGLFSKVFTIVGEHLVVGGLAAIILLLVGIFRERLINLSSWFVPVRVHGSWSTSLGDDNPQTAHEHVTLHQFFNKVWGQAKVQDNSNDIYQVRGQIVGEKLALTFRDKKGFDSGAILLKVFSKKLMQGYEVGVDPAGNLYSEVYVWKTRT